MFTLAVNHKTMLVEIERKYLISSLSFKEEAYKKEYIKQGYISSNPKRSVRIRIKENEAFLTIKGKSSKDGTTRFEWEKKISVDEANSLFNLCEEGVIEKYRYLVKYENHIFEVDEFLGNNQGLFIAEVELEKSTEKITLPKWIDKEVTGDTRYYNSYLSKKPFKEWE